LNFSTSPEQIHLRRGRKGFQFFAAVLAAIASLLKSLKP
jgi:hypothetical protein